MSLEQLSKGNFIRLYLHACGESEIPRQFHTWACFSLLAACVADRVVLKWMAEKPLIPNLYVFLIAPSGLGKDLALASAMSLATTNEEVESWVNVRQAKLSGPALLDLLGKKELNEETGDYTIANSKIWLVHPELAQYLGKGETAAQLVEILTGLYGGNMKLYERTRTSGSVNIKNACINWAAGTTQEWLLRNLKSEDVFGGFFARVITIYTRQPTPENLMWRPRYPTDRDAVLEVLQRRVIELCNLQGECRLTPEADTEGKQWYYNRQPPDDEMLCATWNREREMVFKLAMLLALADGTKDLMVDDVHIRGAVALWNRVQRTLPDLLELANRTPTTGPTRAVADYMRKVGQCTHTQLSKRMHRRGIDTQQLWRAIHQLRQWGNLVSLMNESGGAAYIWQEKQEEPKPRKRREKKA